MFTFTLSYIIHLHKMTVRGHFFYYCTWAAIMCIRLNPYTVFAYVDSVVHVFSYFYRQGAGSSIRMNRFDCCILTPVYHSNLFSALKFLVFNMILSDSDRICLDSVRIFDRIWYLIPSFSLN